jgi:hypothetical protein
MTITEYAATLARAFMAAEIAMVRSIAEQRTSLARRPKNCLAITLPSPNGRSPGPRLIIWTAGPDPSTTTGQSGVLTVRTEFLEAETSGQKSSETAGLHEQRRRVLTF